MNGYCLWETCVHPPPEPPAHLQTPWLSATSGNYDPPSVLCHSSTEPWEPSRAHHSLCRTWIEDAKAPCMACHEVVHKRWHVPDQHRLCRRWCPQHQDKKHELIWCLKTLVSSFANPSFCNSETLIDFYFLFFPKKKWHCYRVLMYNVHHHAHLSRKPQISSTSSSSSFSQQLWRRSRHVFLDCWCHFRHGVILRIKTSYAATHTIDVAVLCFPWRHWHLLRGTGKRNIDDQSTLRIQWYFYILP